MTVHSRGTLNSDHRRHDRLLVTRFAAGDSYPAEKSEAESLVAGCSDCAQLAADIRLLSQRTGELTVPRRPRDFRISAEQAAKLHGSWFDRLMRGLAAPGWGSALRPVAGAAFALGLMLVVVGALPLGAASPTPESDRAGSGAGVPTIDVPAMAPMASPAEGVTGQQAPTSGGEVPPAEADNGKDGDPNDINEVYVQSPEPVGEGGLEQDFGTADAGLVSQSNLSLVYIGVMVALLGGALLTILLFARRRYGDALVR